MFFVKIFRAFGFSIAGQSPPGDSVAVIDDQKKK